MRGRRKERSRGMGKRRRKMRRLKDVRINGILCVEELMLTTAKICTDIYDPRPPINQPSHKNRPTDPTQVLVREKDLIGLPALICRCLEVQVANSLIVVVYASDEVTRE